MFGKDQFSVSLLWNMIYDGSSTNRAEIVGFANDAILSSDSIGKSIAEIGYTS